MSFSPYKSYVADIHLPPAIIVSPFVLTFGYALALTMDYVLIKNDTRFAHIISPMKLRCLIAVYHFLLPIIFASKYDFGNISFMLQPWAAALHIVFLAKSDLSIKEWISMLFKLATFQDDDPTTDTPQEIRTKGLKKMLRGLAKFGIMKIVLDGLLPKDLSDLLSMPVFSPRALFITYVLAFRIYCMMGITDVIMGAVQTTCLVRFKDIFDNPFMAKSPKDFWNKRWNRLVNSIFRQFIFLKAINNSKKASSSTKYGLLVFFISGLFHDFMIAAAARTITFELTAFFLIHGIIVALEAKYRKGEFKKDPSGIYGVMCNLLTVVFFTTTGRLFLAPILRQQAFLRIAQQF